MNYRIGESKKWLMIIIALIVDIVEVFLSWSIVTAVASGFIQYAFMWGMFQISGVNFFGTAKRLRRQITGGVLESIPFAEMLPIYTWNVWTTIEESRKEDRERAESETNNISVNQNIIRQKNQINENQISAQSQNSNIIRQKKP